MYGRRPYGVGMLVAGYDVSHLGRERGRVWGGEVYKGVIAMYMYEKLGSVGYRVQPPC